MIIQSVIMIILLYIWWREVKVFSFRTNIPFSEYLTVASSRVSAPTLKCFRAHQYTYTRVTQSKYVCNAHKSNVHWSISKDVAARAFYCRRRCFTMYSWYSSLCSALSSGGHRHTSRKWRRQSLLVGLFFYSASLLSSVRIFNIQP